jgi:nitrite transporter NirC
MPIPIPEALSDHSTLASTKVTASRDLPRYLLSAALAGAFVGVAVVLLLTVSGPLAAAGSPMTKLVSGAVFGVALTLVVFAGAELVTGNMMVMAQGLLTRTATWAGSTKVIAAALAGNFVGSVVFALAVHGGGVFSTGPAAELLASTVAAKDALSGPQLFWRAVLCNALVCLGLWMAARTRSDTAKLIVLWWALLAFISSGFEHSVANMTTFALAALAGTGDWAMLGRNLLWTVPGNLVGGAVVVGAAYAYLGSSPRKVVSVGGVGDAAAEAVAPSNGSAPVPVAGR